MFEVIMAIEFGKTMSILNVSKCRFIYFTKHKENCYKSFRYQYLKDYPW